MRNIHSQHSAHVQSELIGEIRSSVDLETSDEVLELMNRFDQINSHSDRMIEQRVKKSSLLLRVKLT
jgi:hypothetical protein